MKVFRSARAQEDLIEIWAYIAADSERAADEVIDAIDTKIAAIQAFPSIGPVRDDIRPGFRMLVHGAHLILYRIANDGIEIVRVVHGRRNLLELDE